MRGQHTMITNTIEDGNTDDGDSKARDKDKFGDRKVQDEGKSGG